MLFSYEKVLMVFEHFKNHWLFSHSSAEPEKLSDAEDLLHKGVKIMLFI